MRFDSYLQKKNKTKKDQEGTSIGNTTLRLLEPIAVGIIWRSTVMLRYRKLPKSYSVISMEAPKFHYDMDFDLRALKEALKSAKFLESGYQFVLERSQHNQYGAGWIIHQYMSEVNSDTDDDNWDGFMDVGNKRTKIKEISDILVSRFAFITGARTKDGNPMLIFPDSRSQLTEEQLDLLISCLLQLPPLGRKNKRNGEFKFNSFPRPVRIVLVLKPESVLQRALEVGYRGITENYKFKII
uniref:Uncharacterized protein n=1 Tax=Wuchereria bancrofti TaxID=6293 RepID=A0A1I8EME6_WUCBA